MKKRHTVLRILLTVILIPAAAVAAFLIFLSVTEYKPAAVEDLTVSGDASETLSPGDSLRVMTWNIGYGALGDNADFFMDGGSMVNTASEERVRQNLTGIETAITEADPDLLFLQEIDVNSSRSHHINEYEQISSADGYDNTFARNLKTAFIPYPIPPIGTVDSGICTMSRYPIESAQRISLPCPFRWPVSMANLKRCLNVSRIPLEGTDHQLYLVNLHLEAYDDGEGKEAQTAQLKAILEEAAENGDYVIAGGDFNQRFSTVDSSAYPVLEGTWQPGNLDMDAFSSALSVTADASVPTCRSLDRPLDSAESTDPSDFQYYVIDGFIVSDNITVQNVTTEDLGFRDSDHNPVIMDITLK